MRELLIIVEAIIFCYLSIATLYVALFAIASKVKRVKEFPSSNNYASIVILVPAYREESVIFDTVNSLLKQDYPKEKREIVVISDKMPAETNTKLRALEITLIEINPQKSSKALAINLAMKEIRDNKYNLISIIDADNTLLPNYLSALNDAYQGGAEAIQAHRCAKNIEGDVALLDAISEEINNSIYRKGHQNLGLSSALIGSGMAFDYDWFCNHFYTLTTVGEDKELEILLLKKKIFIYYLDNIRVFDQKVTKEQTFYNQRRRWLGTQFLALKLGLPYLPSAFTEGNIGYIDKLFQWLLPPRVLLIGGTYLFTLLALIFARAYFVKWAFLVLLLSFSLLVATPKEYFNKRTVRAIGTLPILFILMVMNLFRLKGSVKSFIHTKKE